MDERDVRVFFSKKGRAKYISHLDLNRCMQRALKRSRLPVWYTEGFNPHAYVTFALPLSLGVESDCEVMDMRLEGERIDLDGARDALNAVLPPDIRVTAVCRPILKPTKIVYSEYAITAQSEESNGLLDKWEEFLSAEKIEITKKSKKGMVTIDILPDICVLHLEGGSDVLRMLVRLPSSNVKTVNPLLMMTAFGELTGARLDRLEVCRKRILTAEGKDFA